MMVYDKEGNQITTAGSFPNLIRPNSVAAGLVARVSQLSSPRVSAPEPGRQSYAELRSHRKRLRST